MAGRHALDRVTAGRTYQFSLIKQIAAGVGGYLSRRLEVAVVNAAALALRAMARTDHRRHTPSVVPQIEALEAAGKAVRPELEGQVRVYLARGARFERPKGHAEAYAADMADPLYGQILGVFSEPAYIVRVAPVRVVAAFDEPYEGELAPEEADAVDPDAMGPAG